MQLWDKTGLGPWGSGRMTDLQTNLLFSHCYANSADNHGVYLELTAEKLWLTERKLLVGKLRSLFLKLRRDAPICDLGGWHPCYIASSSKEYALFPFYQDPVKDTRYCISSRDHPKY
jgi:hypothetical protein